MSDWEIELSPTLFFPWFFVGCIVLMVPAGLLDRWISFKQDPDRSHAGSPSCGP